MHDNSKQRSAVLSLIMSTVGSALVGLVVRQLRQDRAAARGGRPARKARRSAPGTAPGRRTPRGPVL